MTTNEEFRKIKAQFRLKGVDVARLLGVSQMCVSSYLMAEDSKWRRKMPKQYLELLKWKLGIIRFNEFNEKEDD